MIKSVSPSAVGTYNKCGEQYRRRYVEGEKIPPGVTAHVGTGIHKGAEINHKHKIKEGKDQPVDVIQDAAVESYEKSLQNGIYLTPEEKTRKAKILGEGKDMTSSLAGLYRESLAPQIHPVLVEKFIKIHVDELPVPILSRLDVATADHWVPDLKSAKKSWRQEQVDGSHQLAVYRKGYEQEQGTVPEVSMEVLVYKATPAHQNLVANVDDSDFDAFVVRAQKMLEAVRAGIFPPADPSHWICQPRFCGYWWSCPYISSNLKQSAVTNLPEMS